MGDRLTHAELAHATLAAAGGGAGEPVDRDTLHLTRDPDVALEVDVWRATLELLCLGETVVTRLVDRMIKDCTVESAHKALKCAADSAERHREFGWTIMKWMLEGPGADLLRTHAEIELPPMIERLYETWAIMPTATDPVVGKTERAWGVVSVDDYRDALLQAIGKDFEPQFEDTWIDVTFPLP